MLLFLMGNIIIKIIYTLKIYNIIFKNSIILCFFKREISETRIYTVLNSYMYKYLILQTYVQSHKYLMLQIYNSYLTFHTRIYAVCI